MRRRPIPASVAALLVCLAAGCSRPSAPPDGPSAPPRADTSPSVDTSLIDVAANLPPLPPVCPPDVSADLPEDDEDVCETLAEAYETALADVDLKPIQRAALFVSAAQKIHDYDELSDILQGIADGQMPNSLAIRTIVTIMRTGNATSHRLLQEVINDLTDTDEEDGLISTPEALWKWYNDPSGDNLDDEDEGD